jgi:hypothetical protein
MQTTETKVTELREQFTAIADARALAQGIVDTVREPVLVLDKDLRVIAASRRGGGGVVGPGVDARAAVGDIPDRTV